MTSGAQVDHDHVESDRRRPDADNFEVRVIQVIALFLAALFVVTAVRTATTESTDPAAADEANPVTSPDT